MSLAALLLLLASTATSGACRDVVDLSRELPAEQVTPAGVRLAYEYDLDNDQYWLSWNAGHVSGGPLGPFHLTMACGTSELAWETDDYLVLHRGCGTFCWYWEVVSISTGASSVTRIERPLAHDAHRALVARYAERDVIEVRNLKSGSSQRLTTPYRCEYASGLCFDDVVILDDALEYRWLLDPTGEVIIQPLDHALLDQDSGP